MSQNTAIKDNDADRPQWERLRILVAEDNQINQLVIMGLLRKLGVTPRLVNNGVEAVAAVQEQPFDLILMDCQMPDLDGYGATGQIRAMAPPLNALPIIALTANAMRGDRERCLAAGMNDHVAKPIAMEALTAAMRPYIPAATSLTLSVVTEAEPEAPAGLDAKALAGLAFLATGANVNFVAELIETFLDTTPARLSKMQQAAATGDMKTVHFEAHALKSAAGTLGAVLFSSICQEIEDQAPTGAGDKVNSLLPRLTSEFENVKITLPQLAVSMGLGRT